MSESSAKEGAAMEGETFEMLKSLYDFESCYPKTISFEEGEFFLQHQIEKISKQRNWWQVVSIRGNIGFVPSNYVMKIKVDPTFLTGFIDSSIESLKISEEVEINGIISREELIVRLEEKKRLIDDFIKNGSSKEMNAAVSHTGTLHKKAANGSVKNREIPKNDPSIEQDQTPTREKQESPKTSSTKQTKTKRPAPSPAVSNVGPQMIPESPSTSSISSIVVKAEEQAQQENTNSTLSDPTVSETEALDTLQPSSTVSNTTSCTSDNVTVISTTEKEEIPVEKLEEKIPEEIPERDKNVVEEPEKKPELNCNHNHVNTTIVAGKIEAQDVYQIVDSIRKCTNLSHDASCAALRVVISELEVLLPPAITKYLEPVALHLTAPLPAPDNLLGQTFDAQRLRIIFSELADCKNDSEQRTWMLYEDENEISQYLSELIHILTDADKKISCHELSCEQYQSIINLVLYYQMETRWSIRKLLLKAFKVMCHLDITAVDILLNSVLPIELAQDMISNPTNVEKLSELANMLIIVFAVGKKLPVNHQESMQSDFIQFLMNIVENQPDTDINGVLPDIIINLILSFNLQFDITAENIVLDAMEQIQSAKTFTEKILLLINREEDPVNLLKHTPPPINSVLKMIVDLFSKPETAALFYTNDNKVLIDILVRQLSDQSAGDPVRKWYLELCRKLVRNTNYGEHTHRRQDLLKIFTRIFCEETECSANDQQIVREIINEFPQIFKA